MSKLSDYLELSDYWRSITRRPFLACGNGKWKIYTKDAHQVYKILREVYIASGLKDVTSIKVRDELEEGIDNVYVYTAPYTDLNKVSQLAEELLKLHWEHNFRMDRPLHFKTDLHTNWQKSISASGDGYHELLSKKNWIYKYVDGKLEINAIIDSLHQAMEDPPENADKEFAVIRSMLPREVFAGKGKESKK